MGKQNGKRKKWPVVLIILGIMVGMTVYGAIFQPNATAKKKQAEEQAKTAITNSYGNEIFYEKGRYGIKRDGQIISDSVWESVKEVSEGDLLYYVIGYRDKTKGAERRNEYTSIANLDDELRYGILDADGHVVVEPVYTDIDCGKSHYNESTRKSTIEPYPGDYIIFTDFVDDGGSRTYVNVTDGGTKKDYKTRHRKDYLVRKGTWEIICDLGDHLFSSFIGDDYIVVWRIDHITSTGGAVQPTGIFSISRRKVLWEYDNVSTSGIRYFPGKGFGAKSYYKDEKPNVYITTDGRIIRGGSMEFDEAADMIWVYDSSSRKGKYMLYDFNASRIGDFHLDKNPYKTADGRSVQVVYSETQGYQLFEFESKTCKTIEGAVKVDKWSEGFIAVENTDQKWGYMNDRGEFLFDYQFDEAEQFKDGKASVIQGYNRYTVDRFGSIK